MKKPLETTRNCLHSQIFIFLQFRYQLQCKKSDLIVEVVQISRNKYVNVAHNLQHIQTLKIKIKMTTVIEKDKKKFVFTKSKPQYQGFPNFPSMELLEGMLVHRRVTLQHLCRAANHKTAALSTHLA